MRLRIHRPKTRNLLAKISLLYCVGLLLLWVIETFVAERHWTSLLITYTPQQGTIAPGLLLLALALWRRNWRVAAANLVGLGTIAVLFLGWNFPLSVTPHRGQRLRLMSYNIEHGENNLGGVVNLIRTQQPDVLCLQEANGFGKWADATSRVQNQLDGWHLVRNGDVSIFSRYPIISSKAHPALRWSSRGNLEATINANGKSFTIFSVHLATITLKSDGVSLPVHINRVRAARRAQLDILLHATATAPQPVVVMGDFNTPPRGLIYQRITRHFTDAFTSIRWGFGHTFRADIPVLRIDYAWLGRGVQAVRYQTPSVRYSDHRPIVVDVALP